VNLVDNLAPWLHTSVVLRLARRARYPACAAALVATALALFMWGGTTGASSNSSRTVVYRFGVVGNRGALTQLQLNRPTPVLGIKGRVVQVATSNSDGYALTSSGSVWAWGVASYGELGNGTDPAYSTRAVQVAFPAGLRIAALANPMPFDGALAIDSQGHVWGWGLNALGDLCLSGLTELKPAELPLGNVTLATGARTHSLFASGGSVYACGSGQYGVLGTGSTTSSATPVRVSGLPNTVRVTGLTSSWEGSGALFGNGSYYDWGYNAAGQVGNGSTADSELPVRVSLPGAVHQVFQGGSGPTNGQTVAILANGSVWAWGDNHRGQLGDGTKVSSDVPLRVDVPRGVSFERVSSGGYASFAIDRSDRLWAWGGNQSGQLGTGGTPVVATRPIMVGIRLTQISSTAQNVAGLRGSALRS
jgi:alpha-tubulin suppressor-like RCC1 family protein